VKFARFRASTSISVKALYSFECKDVGMRLRTFDFGGLKR